MENTKKKKSYLFKSSFQLHIKILRGAIGSYWKYMPMAVGFSVFPEKCWGFLVSNSNLAFLEKTAGWFSSNDLHLQHNSCSGVLICSSMCSPVVWCGGNPIGLGTWHEWSVHPRTRDRISYKVLGFCRWYMGAPQHRMCCGKSSMKAENLEKVKKTHTVLSASTANGMLPMAMSYLLQSSRGRLTMAPHSVQTHRVKFRLDALGDFKNALHHPPSFKTRFYANGYHANSTLKDLTPCFQEVYKRILHLKILPFLI